MPAVQLPRLKEQISKLAWHFTRPVEFQKQLHALFDLYSDRTYRPGQAVKARPLILTYHVAPLVIRQINHDLGHLCEENPGAALALVDELWKDSYLEPRLLAASLLGQTSLTPPEPVLERILAWTGRDIDTQLLEILTSRGSIRLRREQPERWLVLIEQWLSDPQNEIQEVGLKALIPLIQDREFENIPRIFRLLGPLVQNAPKTLYSELTEVLTELARRAPAESAYFLRQMMSIGNNMATTRLVRRCLPAFNEEMQINLRKILTNRSEINGRRS
jgi:hypothetical protein